MESKTINGKIEVWAIQPTQKGDKEFIKMRVDGKSYNLFDMGLYEKVKTELKPGTDAKITYTDNVWKDLQGNEHTSHVIQNIEFDGAKNLADFSKAVEVPPSRVPNEDDVDVLMKMCIQAAYDMCMEFDGFFTPDNVTSIANCMMIEVCRRNR